MSDGWRATRRLSTVAGRAKVDANRRSYVQNLWTDGVNPVENLTRKKILAPGSSTNLAQGRVLNGLRDALRLIEKRDCVELQTAPIPPDIDTRDSSSLPRNHWRARVRHRGDARQQPMARATLSHAGSTNSDDAVLRNDTRRSGAAPGQVADARARWRTPRAPEHDNGTGHHRNPE